MNIDQDYKETEEEKKQRIIKTKELISQLSEPRDEENFCHEEPCSTGDPYQNNKHAEGYNNCVPYSQNSKKFYKRRNKFF